LVQNAVFDVNGDDAGSAVTCEPAELAADATFGCFESLLHAPTATVESASAHANNPTNLGRPCMVIPLCHPS
jgi:hypothetical protein